MKKFLNLFLVVFTILAMSTVAFAGDTYVHNKAPYTKDELVEKYGALPTLIYAGTGDHILTYDGANNTYILTGLIFCTDAYGYTSKGIKAELVYDTENNFYTYSFKFKTPTIKTDGYYSIWKLNLNDAEPTWNIITEREKFNSTTISANVTYSPNIYTLKNLTTASIGGNGINAVWTSQEVAVYNDAGNYTAGDSFFFLAPEPETILQVVTKLQETTAEQMKIAEILKTITIVAVSCLASWTLFLILSKVLRIYLP